MESGRNFRDFKVSNAHGRVEDNLAPAVGIFWGVIISLWFWLILLSAIGYRSAL